MLIFGSIPPFYTPLSPFIIVSNIVIYWLPPNWAIGTPKLAPNLTKMGKMTIFPKLKGLECSFLILSPILHTTEWIYNIFKHSHLLVTPKLDPRDPKIGPKPIQNG